MHRKVPKNYIMIFNIVQHRRVVV